MKKLIVLVGLLLTSCVEVGHVSHSPVLLKINGKDYKVSDVKVSEQDHIYVVYPTDGSSVPMQSTEIKSTDDSKSVQTVVVLN